MGRSLTMRRSLRAGVLAGCGVLCAALLPAAASAVPQPRTAPTGQSFAFTYAQASHADGAYRIAWESNGGTVTVVANHDPESLAGAVIGGGAARGTITVPDSSLPAGARWYFHLDNTRRSISIAPQSLGFPDDPNLRDVGGIRTTDGHWVKEGLLLRGGAMNHLSDSEVEALASMAISTAIDFRTHDEAVAAPDRLPAGVPSVADSVLVNDDPSVTWAIGDLDYVQALKIMGYARGQYLFLYDEFGGAPGATYAYRTFFRAVLAAHGAPILYHCTAGDDRTGWATYVLLRLLGVSAQDAMANYLDSNTYNSEMLQGYTSAFQDAGFTHDQADFFLTSDYITAAEQSAVRIFGSWDNYISQGLGLSASDIATLKRTYLAS